jgi:uncharacterized protein
MTFQIIVLAVAMGAGGIASVAGFGIGSLLTPLLGIAVGIKVAVVLVSIPHFIGTGLRLTLVRRHVNRRVLLTFGVASAVGGLGGALAHSLAQSAGLGKLLGALLVFAGLMEIFGVLRRIHFNRAAAWAAGGLSGALGGLVGNQGGIRSAAMLAFDVEKEAFVATATAIGLLVDLARMPVYLATQGNAVVDQWRLVAVATVGVVAGTLVGKRVLGRIPERRFRQIVAVIILGLGVSLLVGG